MSFGSYGSSIKTLQGHSSSCPSVAARSPGIALIGWSSVPARRPSLFQAHAHMLRHTAGYKLAGDGHDTRSIQDYLGHKDIRHTVRYTELSPKPFRDFWRD